MDPLAILLCGVGATVIFAGGQNGVTDIIDCLLMFAGFYGVYRVMRTTLTKALVAAPAVIWLFEQLPHLYRWSVERGSFAEFALRIPANLAHLVLSLALLSVAATGRARIGRVLATITVVALGIDLFFRIVPTGGTFFERGTATSLILATEHGWAFVARTFGAICMFVVGLGTLPIPPLPRRGGAIAGVVGAMLLTALVRTIDGLREPGAVYFAAFWWFLGYVLTAIGLGAVARAGAKGAGWAGMGLTVLGIFGLFMSIAVFDSSDLRPLGLLMSSPFCLFGIALALFAWKGAPLDGFRKALGAVFAVAFVAGALAWAVTYLGLLRIANLGEPTALAEVLTLPLATYGLPLWGALLAILAAPPGAAPAQPPQPQPPPQHPMPPQGPPQGPPGWHPPYPQATR